jgi:hypothetical protein
MALTARIMRAVFIWSVASWHNGIDGRRPARMQKETGVPMRIGDRPDHTAQNGNVRNNGAESSQQLLDRRMKLLASAVACGALAMTAGCASVERSPALQPKATAPADVAAPVAVASPATTPAAAPSASAAAGNSAPTTPIGAANADTASGSTQPEAVPAAPPAAPKSAANARVVAKAVAPAARVTTAVTSPPAKTASAPAVDAAKPATAPPLDLKSLEARLRETSAVGVMTKLTLKNQVDDLLDQFREFYRGKLKTTLAQLRQSYDRLVMKVLALLQDADPPLANAIASSREAIWGILADPAKFAAV